MKGPLNLTCYKLQKTPFCFLPVHILVIAIMAPSIIKQWLIVKMGPWVTYLFSCHKHKLTDRYFTFI